MRSFAILLVFGTLAGAAGCQSTMAKLRGEGFSNDNNQFAAQGSAFRKPEGESKPFGFSTRAREIEKSMGVQ